MNNYKPKSNSNNPHQDAPNRFMPMRQKHITQKNFTLFHSISRDICKTISRDLRTRDIKALTETSASVRELFNDVFTLRKHAHIILQAIMDGVSGCEDESTNERVRNLIAEAKVVYGDDVWKLLLTRTSGTEKHCMPPRHWDDVSVIEFVAWTGNLAHYMYDVQLMDRANPALVHGTLYVEVESFGTIGDKLLNYRVLNPDYKVMEDSITEDQLDIKLLQPINIDQIKAHLPTILNITCERGDTTDQYPDEHQNVPANYLLNILFNYIPSNHRHHATEQLQYLQDKGSAHGEVMLPYLQLVNEGFCKYISAASDCSDATATAISLNLPPEPILNVEITLKWLNELNNQIKSLPMFGLEFICDEHLQWQPMPNYNLLVLRQNPVLLNFRDHTRSQHGTLKSYLPDIGVKFGISVPGEWDVYCRSGAGAAVQKNRSSLDAVRRFHQALRCMIDVKRMQLRLFIASQMKMQCENAYTPYKISK